MKRNVYALVLAMGLSACTVMTGAAAEAVTEQAETVTEAVSESIGGTDPEVTLSGIEFATDYKQIYQVLKAASPTYYYDLMYASGYDAAVENSVESASSSGMETAETAASVDYSEVNTREAAVDEADVARTDGTCIYLLQDGAQLLILSADGASSRLLSRTTIDVPILWTDTDGLETTSQYTSITELYAAGDQVCVLGQTTRQYRTQKTVENSDTQTSDDWYWSYGGHVYTFMITYDVSDRTAPVMSGMTWQDGNYAQSRRTGDVVCLYSTCSPDLGGSYEETQLEGNLIPRVNGTPLEATQVCLPTIVTSASYLLVSSVRLSAPSDAADQLALVSGADQFYVSEQNLYVINEQYETYSEKTEICKFRCDDGQLAPVASCRLRGYVNDSFAVDEYDGNLRVLTTYTGSQYGALSSFLADLLGIDYYDPERWVHRNALYILDEQMHKLSSITGIARDEDIRSSRYLGETAYFVTYENTDPLFAADLSDPENPKLLGSLKVTGFSSYLHPYGEGRLLGIGYETDEESGQTLGVKLSMFDISDPANVQEISRTVIPGVYWCAALDNYKAILASPDRNLIGFELEDRYLLYSWSEEDGFTRELIYDFFEDGFNGDDYNDTNTRGLYAGDYFYVAGNHFLSVFGLNDSLTKAAALDLKV